MVFAEIENVVILEISIRVLDTQCYKIQNILKKRLSSFLSKLSLCEPHSMHFMKSAEFHDKSYLPCIINQNLGKNTAG